MSLQIVFFFFSLVFLFFIKLFQLIKWSVRPPCCRLAPVSVVLDLCLNKLDYASFFIFYLIFLRERESEVKPCIQLSETFYEHHMFHPDIRTWLHHLKLNPVHLQITILLRYTRDDIAIARVCRRAASKTVVSVKI